MKCRRSYVIVNWIVAEAVFEPEIPVTVIIVVVLTGVAGVVGGGELVDAPPADPPPQAVIAVAAISPHTRSRTATDAGQIIRPPSGRIIRPK